MKSKLASSGFMRAALSTVTVIGVSVTGFFAVPAQASAPPDGAYSCATGTTDGPSPRYNITGGVVSIGSGLECLGAVVIPAGVEEIGNSAFEGGLLQSIIIPNSVISIGTSAFDTSSLESISFEPGSALETIGSYAFLYSAIESIDLSNSNSLVTIGEGAFQEVTTLTSISIPTSVTSIGDSAFRSTMSLASITIPASVTSIGAGAFANSGIQSITFQERVLNSTLTIGESAFASSGLASIAIPIGVTSIARSTFMGAESLASVTIPDTVISIGENAFVETGSLESISIPDSVTSIGAAAFAASDLRSISIPGSVSSIGEDAFVVSKIQSITFLDRAQYSSLLIGEGAFERTPLRSIEIPKGVTSIERSTFSGAESLVSVTIPDTVNSIGTDAFEGASSLASVYLLGNAPTILADADPFQGVATSARAYVGDYASGFGATWERLEVQRFSSLYPSLYRDWQVPLPSISNGPIVGETVHATAFERVLSRNLHKPDQLDGQYLTNFVTYPTPEEYVYRITRTPNDRTTSVDHQSDDGYEMLSASDQQDWYRQISPATPYLFSWKAFVCSDDGDGTLSVPTGLFLSYASREDGALQNPRGFSTPHNLMFRDAAIDWIGYSSAFSPRTLVGTKINDGSYSVALLGDPDTYWQAKVYGILDVSSSCGVGKTLESLPIVDINGDSITTKSFEIPTQLRLNNHGVHELIEPIGLTIGVTGGGFAPEFHAALWGLTTIADPNAATPTPSPRPSASGSSSMATASLVTTGANPIAGGLILGSAVTLATLGALLLWKRRRLGN
jgi:hypothetical protein